MTDMISMSNGKWNSAFASDVLVWHDHKGKVFSGCFSIEEGLRETDMTWDPIKQKLFDERGTELPIWGIFRSDNNGFLGAVKGQYHPMSFSKVFVGGGNFLSASDKACINAMAQLDGGKTGFMSIKLSELDVNVGPDKLEAFLVVTTSHDGSSAIEYIFTLKQVVCKNTLIMARNAAIKAATNQIYRIKHSSQAQVAMDTLKVSWEGLRNGVLAVEGHLNLLSKTKIKRDGIQAVMDKLFPLPEDKHQSRKDNVRMDIMDLFEDNDGNTYPEFRGTSYNLLNAITNYVDHSRTTRVMTDNVDYASSMRNPSSGTLRRPICGRNASSEDEAYSRAKSAMFGSGASLKEQAMQTILEMTTDGRTIESYRPAQPTGGDLLDMILS